MNLSICRQDADVEVGLQKKMERRKTKWRVRRSKRGMKRRLEESSMTSTQDEVAEFEVEEVVKRSRKGMKRRMEESSMASTQLEVVQFSSFVGNQKTEDGMREGV